MSRRALVRLSLSTVLLLLLALFGAATLVQGAHLLLSPREQQATVDAAIADRLTQTAQAAQQNALMATIDAGLGRDLTATAEFEATVAEGVRLTVTELARATATPSPTPTPDELVLTSDAKTVTAEALLTDLAQPTATVTPSRTLTATVTATPTIDATPTRDVTGLPTATLNVGTGPIRAEGRGDAAVIGELSAGDEVVLIGRNDAGTYLFVQAPDGTEGWVARQLLTVNVPVPDLPVVTDAEAAAAPPKPTLTPADTDAPPTVTEAAVDPAAFNGEALAQTRLLTEPDNRSDAVATIERGTPVSVIAQSEDGLFFLVETADGQQGWVLSAIIRFDGDRDALPSRTAEGDILPTATPLVLLGDRAITIEPTNVRREPSLNAPLVIELPRDTVVEVLGRSDNGQYFYIRTAAGVEGWALRPLFNFNFDVDDLDVIDPREADGTSQATTVPLPTLAISPVNTLVPTFTLTPTPTLLPTNTPAPAADGDPTARVVVTNAAVRAEPTLTAATVTTISLDEVVTLLGRSADSDFLLIRTPDGIEGWVGRPLLVYAIPFDQIPVVTPDTPTATPTLIGADADRTVTGTLSTSAANVRAAPRLGSAPVVRLREGDTVTVLGRNPEGTYYFVETDAGETGWIAEGFITLDTPLGTRDGSADDLPVIVPESDS